MSLANWFNRARRQPPSPRLQELVGKVVSYLKDRPAEDDVVPKFIAKAINESEVSVFTALRFLEERGLAKEWFAVFCGTTDVPLGRFDTLQDIPKELVCEVCDEQHCLVDHTCKVEVVYTVNRERLADFDIRESAA
jgi:hypothetical protein